VKKKTAKTSHTAHPLLIRADVRGEKARKAEVCGKKVRQQEDELGSFMIPSQPVDAPANPSKSLIKKGEAGVRPKKERG